LILHLEPNSTASQRPKFLTHLPTKATVNLDGSLLLRSTFSGLPIPSVQWLKNGEALAEPRLKTVTTNNETTLEIRRVRAGDEGEYSCKLCGVSAIEVSSCQVELERRLGFRTFLASRNLGEGQPLVLSCAAAPTASAVELVWLRNGKSIPESPDFVRARDGDVFTLTVGEIYPEDSGLFSAQLVCDATDEVCFCSCSVFVQGD
jgi:hypothetical protein